MVFQKGNDIDESRVLVAQYDHFADGSKVDPSKTYKQPWYDYNDLLAKITIRDRIAPTYMAGWFMYVRNVPDDQFKNIEYIDTSQCTTFYCLFNYAQFEELDLTCWDVSNVKNMNGLFSHQNGRGLQKLNISNWDVSNVNGNFGAFIYESAIEEIDISSFNPVKCSSFSGMFEANKNLKRVKIGNFQTYRGSIFSNMFLNCINLESVYSTEPVEGVADLTSITSQSAKSFTSMFRGCKLIEHVDFGENITTRKNTEDLAFECTFEGGTISQDRTQVTFDNLNYTKFKALTSSMFSIDDGSVLASWNIRPNGTDRDYAATDSVNKLTPKNGDTATLYAQWYTPEAVITFESMGGTSVADKDYNIGDKYGVLPSPSRSGDSTSPAGYTFMGWFTEPGENGLEIVNLDDDDENYNSESQQNRVTKSKTLYAHWEPNCAVTFDPNGGTIEEEDGSTKVVMYGQTLGKLPVPENGTSAFIGWFTEKGDGSRVTNQTVMDVPSVTYYAHWGYKPVFETDGGSFTSYPENGYPVQSEPRYDFSSYELELPTVTKHNCTFLGWFSDVDGDGIYETTVATHTPVELSANTVIKARWKEDDRCTVTLNPDGGAIESGETSITVYKGKPVAELPAAVKEGCDFEGWYDEYDNKYTAETIVNGNVTLTAKWSERQCELTFNPNGGTLYDPANATMVIANGKTIPAIPGVNRKESDGTVRYFFGGWYPNPDCTGEKLTRDTVITENAEYYAKWVEPENCMLIDDLGTTDMNNRLYMYSVNWGTLSDGNVTNNTGDNLVFHPMGSGNVSAMLRIQFHTYDNNNSTDIVIPKNAVRIRIPKNIFKDRNGNPIGTDNINIGLSSTPSPNADFYYTVVSENGEEFYELINNVELIGKHSDFKIFYEADPDEMDGGYIDENGYYRYLDKKFFENNINVTIKVNLNEGDGEGQDHDCKDDKELDYTKDLSLEVHTRVNTTVSKMQTAVSMKWDTKKWGEEPPDSEEYFYVTWKLVSNHSGSTQPFTLTWSEDTVRDGAIVVEPENSDADRTSDTESYSTIVVTKHRRDSVYKDENGWATAHNEAVLSVTWKSGYVQNYRAAAEAYAYIEDPNSSGGGNEYCNFIKTIEKDPSVASNHNKNGGQELVLINNEIPLAYKISYTEIKREEEPVWHAASGTYTAPERTVTITDGDPGDLVIAQHSKNPLPSESEWNSARDVRLNESDYYFDKLDISIKEYDAVKMNETWSNPFEHENQNDYSDRGIIINIRRAGKTETETLAPIVHTASQTVDLPNDTVWFSVKYSSTFYSTAISVNPTVCLKTTNHVKSLVQDHIEANKNSIIKNKSKVTVEQQNKETVTLYSGEEGKSGWVSSYVLNIGESKLYAAKSCADEDHLDFDNSSNIEFLPMVISGFGYNTTGNKKPMKSGEFYDLLPEGYAVDKSTVFVELRTDNTESSDRNANNYYDKRDGGNHLPAAYYSVRFDENWNNTGKTLMTVAVNTPEGTISTGFDVYYMMNTTYANVMINGQNPENMMAFKDTTPSQSIPVDRVGTINTIEKKYRPSFEFADGNQTAFDQEPVNAVSPAYIASGLTSTVKTEGAVTSNHQVIGRNTDYTYTVTYRNDENYTSKDLVLFDLIERKVGGSNSEWFGAFEAIDISSIQKKHIADGVYCNPVVYYSTHENFAESELDVSDTDVWTTVMPPKDQITAVAVDCRKTTAGEDFILGKKDGLSFDIKMHSPGDTDNDLTSYNEAYVRGNFVNLDTKVDNVTQTRVTIHYNVPQFVKSAFPATGTIDKPESVVKNSVIEYVLKITNPDTDVPMLNVKVEDIFCNRVRINNSIRVQVNEEEAVPIDDTPLVSFTITDAENGASKFSATIESIERQQTISIIIPVTVIADKSNNPEENIITNKADILSVNDVPYENPVDSNPTYHVIDEIKAKVLKTNSKGNPLAGAKLNILDKDKNPVPIAYDAQDNPIYDFVSTNEVLSFNLNKGTYYLRELADGVPEDFQKAEDVQFRIDIEGIIYVNNKAVNYVEMKDEPDYRVIFHENNPELEDKNVVFKTYEPNELNDDKSINHFYDIPKWAGDEYVFAGWYHNDDYTETPVDATIAVDFDSDDRDTYPRPTPVHDYHLYAMWIKVDTVSRDNKDQNIVGSYRGFGLEGVQIRTGDSIQRMLDAGIIPPNEKDFYGNNIPGTDDNYNMEDPNYGNNKQPGGLRFVTSIREGLLTDIYNIQKIDATPEEGKSFGVEYGYVVGTYDNIQAFFEHYSDESRLDYTLQYNGENVNGVNTTKKSSLYSDFRYISNVNCTSNQKIGGKNNSGVVEKDHRNFSDYRLYSLIVTYEGDDIYEVDKKIDARAYMRYYDANGKLRVFYNTYNPSRYYGGCMCSFKQALDMSIGKTQHDMLEQ